jgi:hypothetical protein
VCFLCWNARRERGEREGWRVKVKSRQIMKVELGSETKIRKRRKRQGTGGKLCREGGKGAKKTEK